MSDTLTVRPFGRSFTLQDVTVRGDGSGRIVEAYAAAFGVRSEIRDQDGHYNEELSPRSFDKTINDKGTRFGVFYNHARTIWGTPDGNLSVPIGVPVEVRADERGVFTATEYLDNPLADSVLDAVKKRAITGQSFSGRFIKSTRTRAARSGELPTIVRHEVDMREYGPTPNPAYPDAAVTGWRSTDLFLEEISRMEPEERAEFFRTMLAAATPIEPAAVVDTPDGAVAPADEPPNALRSAVRMTNVRFQAKQKGLLG